MVLGFNHNVRYRGEVFHVQTEDSGINNPHIITLLYRGGTILASRKTSYADIIKIENLERVVEELMKDQHRDMLRRLKAGEFDQKAFGTAVAPAVAEPDADNVPEPSAPREPLPPTTSFPASSPAQSLDEIILDYLVAGDER